MHKRWAITEVYINCSEQHLVIVSIGKGKMYNMLDVIYYQTTPYNRKNVMYQKVYILVIL